MTKVDDLDGEKVFIAVFAIVFGAFGAGQASAYGPDASKGKKAAVKIFKVTETPSEIDAMNPKEEAMTIPADFQGKIKFENVWFRYPSRPKQWIFKGLNLEINPMDNIAIVGESGQGKSTFILLLLRFYDAEKGTITIDGVPIEKYNIGELRKQMGLVM
jgi:ATP-binding cassette subfamily B (MDR/TAP) protein 1